MQTNEESNPNGANFFPWLIERVMDAVEETGKKRTGHAVAMHMNKRYGSQLMSQAIVQYKRGEHTPSGSQAIELIEAAGLHPLLYLPFAEFERVFADKRSSARLKHFWAFLCCKWSADMDLETPWIVDVGYLGLSETKGVLEKALSEMGRAV